MVDAKDARAVLHAAGSRPKQATRGGKPQEAGPKIEFRRDAFVDETPTTERRYVERREDLAKDYEGFLVGYTKRLLEMRDSYDPRMQQAWNSKFAQEDKVLLQELLGEHTDFGGKPGEADAAVRKKAQEYLQTNRGWSMATDAIVRQIELSYRVQGLAVSPQDVQVATEGRTFTGGVSTGREGLKRVLKKNVLAGAGVVSGAILGAAGGYRAEGSLRGAALGAAAGGVAVLGGEVGGYLARHKLARGLKYVKNLWEGDQRVQYNSQVLRALQNNPTEAAYAEALTGIDVAGLTPADAGVGNLPVQKTNELNAAARKNLESVKKFYRSLGVEADPLTRPQELTINKKAQEIFETRVTTLGRTDKWGQDSMNACYLRKDCGRTPASIAERAANIDDVFDIVKQIREQSARTAGARALAVIAARVTDATTAAEIIAAGQMEGVDHVVTSLINTRLLALRLSLNEADLLRGTENVAEGRAVKERLTTGRPAMTVTEVDLVRARAVPRQVEHYFLDLPVVPPATSAQREAAIQENASREEEIFRLRREAHAAAISNVGMEMIKNNPPRSQTVESAMQRLQTRKGEIQQGTGTEIQKLEGQKASIQVNEDAVNREMTDHIQPLETARTEIKRLEEQGVTEFGVARDGDFAANIDAQIAAIDTRLKTGEARAANEAVTGAFTQLEQKRQALRELEETLQGPDFEVAFTGAFEKDVRDRLTQLQGWIGDETDPTKGGLYQDIYNLNIGRGTRRADLIREYSEESARGFGITVSDLSDRQRESITANALQQEREEYAQRGTAYKSTIDKHTTQATELRKLLRRYQQTKREHQGIEQQVVEVAAREIDLVQARTDLLHVVNPSGGTPTINAEMLSSDRVSLDDLVQLVTKPPYSFPHATPMERARLMQQLINARMEQRALNQATYDPSPTEQVAAFEGLIFDSRGVSPANPITPNQLLHNSEMQLVSALRSEYAFASGMSPDDLRMMVSRAQQEARKRFTFRYDVLRRMHEAGLPAEEVQNLTKLKEDLQKLKTDYAAALEAQKQAEQRLLDFAKQEISQTQILTDYEKFVGIGGPPPIGEVEVSTKTIDELMTIVEVNLGMYGVPMGTDAEKEAVRKMLMNAKAEQRARVVEAETDKSDPEQKRNFEDIVSRGIARPITPEELLTTDDAVLLGRLHTDYGEPATPETEAKLERARRESRKRLRIRYEALIHQRLNDFGRQKEALDEQIRALQEAQRQRIPEIATVEKMMEDFNRLPQAAIDIVAKIDTYTAQNPLDRAADLNRTEAEYTISSAATTTPRSYLEFLDLIMNCGSAGDRNACFAEGHKLLNEQAMADRMIASLPLQDTAGNRLATGTSIQDTLEALERGVKGGQMNPKNLYDFLVSTVEDFAKRSGTL